MNTNNSADDIIKKQLAELLTQGHAHVTFEDSVKDINLNNIGFKPGNLPFSIWQLTEHIRITQWDILDFSANPNYQSRKWPDDYWPKEEAPTDEAAWDNSIQQIKKDLDQFIMLLNDPSSNLYAPFPHGDGQNLLREAMLLADHTSYHTGEIIVLRRLFGDWE